MAPRKHEKTRFKKTDHWVLGFFVCTLSGEIAVTTTRKIRFPPICSSLQYKEKMAGFPPSPSMFDYSCLESICQPYISVFILWINASYKVNFYAIENLVHDHKKNNYVNWTPHVGTWNYVMSFWMEDEQHWCCSCFMEEAREINRQCTTLFTISSSTVDNEFIVGPCNFSP